MASSSKKKTTFAKLNREAAVRERRQIKEARRAARKLEGPSSTDGPPVADTVEDVSHLDVAVVEGVLTESERNSVAK